MMAKYYVLTSLNSYDKGITPFDDLKEALSYYEEWMGYGMGPVLVERLEVKLSATDLNGQTETSVQQANVADAQPLGVEGSEESKINSTPGRG